MSQDNGPGKRIRGHVRLALLRELALGERPQVELAEQYGYTPETISRFKHAHLAEIAEIRANEQDELAGLWIAKKVNRVAAYQEDVERVDGWLEDGAPTVDLMRVRQQALRNAAEELGQLKQTVETTQKITYAVEGVDPADLR